MTNQVCLFKLGFSGVQHKLTYMDNIYTLYMHVMLQIKIFWSRPCVTQTQYTEMTSHIYCYPADLVFMNT